MAKNKGIELDVSDVEVEGVVMPLDQEFGNGDLNVLRDKINEIITKL